MLLLTVKCNWSAGFGGVLFNGTVGLTVYLGKNEKHADWVTLIDKDISFKR
jgi:OOP family OmpA-OmpF porin